MLTSWKVSKSQNVGWRNDSERLRGFGDRWTDEQTNERTFVIVESLSWLKTFITQLRGEQIIFWSPNLFTLFHCGLVRACPERHAWPGPVWLWLGCYCLWMSKLNIGSNTLGHVEEIFCTNSYFYSITLSVSPVYTVNKQQEWKS